MPRFPLYFRGDHRGALDYIGCSPLPSSSDIGMLLEQTAAGTPTYWKLSCSLLRVEQHLSGVVEGFKHLSRITCRVAVYQKHSTLCLVMTCCTPAVGFRFHNVFHRPGKANVNADVLSRYPLPSTPTTPQALRSMSIPSSCVYSQKPSLSTCSDPAAVFSIALTMHRPGPGCFSIRCVRPTKRRFIHGCFRSTKNQCSTSGMAA